MCEKKQISDDKVVKKQIADRLFLFFENNQPELIQDYSIITNQEFYSDCYKKVDDKAIINDLYSRTDIIILTSMSYERYALHYQYLSKSHSEKIVVFNIGLYPQLGDEPLSVIGYYYKWGNYNVLNIASARRGSHMFGGSNDIFRYVTYNRYLNPIVCISFGACFGMLNNINQIGDTIISDRLFPYFVTEANMEDSFFTSQNTIFRLSNSLSNRLKHEVIEKYLVSKEKLGFNVSLGNYITGDPFVNDGLDFDFNYIASHQIYASETEGYGMFKECRGWKYRIPCIIVKSIYEYGIEPDYSEYINKKRFIENIKKYSIALASVHSSIVLNILIEHEVFGDTIPKLIKKKLLPLRSEGEHVIKILKLKEIVDDVIKQKYHADDVSFYMSRHFVERLCEENVIKVIYEDQYHSDTGFVNIVGV